MAVGYIEAKDFIEKCHHFEEDLFRKQDEIRKAHMLYLRLIDDASHHREYLSSLLTNHERNSTRGIEDIEIKDDQAFVKDIFEKTPPFVSETPNNPSERIDPVDIFLSETCTKFLQYLTTLFDMLRKPGNFARAGRLTEDIHKNFKNQMRAVELYYKKLIDKLNEEPSDDEIRRLMQELDSRDKRLEELNTRFCDLELENEELNYQITMYENGNELKTLKEELKRKDMQVSKLQFKLRNKEKAEEEPNNKELSYDGNDDNSVDDVIDSSSHSKSSNDIEMITEPIVVIPGPSNIQDSVASCSESSIVAVDEKKEFTCCGCYRKFFSKKRLRTHVRKNFVPDGQWFKCAHSVPSSRKENNKVKPIILSSKTPSPKLRSSKQVNGSNHSTSKTNVAVECAESSGGGTKEKFECNGCGRMFTTKKHLENHVRRNFISNQVLFKCKSKAVSLSKQEDKMRKGVTDKFECKICKKIFKCRSSEVLHLRMHNNECLFECNTCGKAFTQKVNLLIHLRIHNGERPLSCKTCGKSFTQKGNLLNHQRIHNRERQFLCKICNKSFTQKGNLLNHLRIHNGERPFSCKVCGKSFTQKGNLLNHQRIHNGERPFTCETCGKNYAQKGNLLIHQRLHSADW